MPRKIREISLIRASALTALLLLLFTIRPFWIDYQVSKKTQQLNYFLEEKYPEQEWEISRKEGTQYSPYQLQVKFDNEEDWTYTYSVANKTNFCQLSWTPPIGKYPNEGKHYEGDECGKDLD